MSESNMTPAEALAVLDEAIRDHRISPQNAGAMQKVRAHTAALIAERDALREDAERLDWLDAQNISKRMGWKVNVAPLGNVSVQSVIFLGSEPVTIREAIDAARASAATGGGNG